MSKIKLDIEKIFIEQIHRHPLRTILIVFVVLYMLEKTIEYLLGGI